MARLLQLRRGTTAENDLFTGAVAEPTYDTDRKELRVHDGSTAGGKVVSVSTGTVFAFAGSSAPEGSLVCDGSAISRTDYADLFAVIGSTYGDGDGSTTFNLPDCDGQLPIYDSAKTIGTATNGTAPNIVGEYFPLNMGFPNGTYGTGALYESGNGTRKHVGQSSNNYNNTKTIGFDASRSSAIYTNGATKITPAGIYTLWCIKY